MQDGDTMSECRCVVEEVVLYIQRNKGRVAVCAVCRKQRKMCVPKERVTQCSRQWWRGMYNACSEREERSQTEREERGVPKCTLHER